MSVFTKSASFLTASGIGGGEESAEFGGSMRLSENTLEPKKQKAAKKNIYKEANSVNNAFA